MTGIFVHIVCRTETGWRPGPRGGCTAESAFHRGGSKARARGHASRGSRKECATRSERLNQQRNGEPRGHPICPQRGTASRAGKAGEENIERGICRYG